MLQDCALGARRLVFLSAESPKSLTTQDTRVHEGRQLLLPRYHDDAVAPRKHKAWLAEGEDKTRTGAIDRYMKMGSQVLEKGLDIYRDPTLVSTMAKEGSEITRELAIAVTLSDDPTTAFKGPLGTTKRVAWAEPLPLDEVKTLGRALGCTVNDVLLACAAGALRSYLRDAGETSMDSRSARPCR